MADERMDPPQIEQKRHMIQISNWVDFFAQSIYNDYIGIRF